MGDITSAGVCRNGCWTPTPFYGGGMGPTTTKEPWFQIPQMAADNAKQDYRHTEAWEGLCDSKALQTNIPPVSYVQTLRKDDTEQNITNHRTAHN